MHRKTLVVAWLLATVACVESPMVDDDAHDELRMETDEVSMESQWSTIRFKWGLPYLLEGETRYVDAVVIDSLGRETEDLPIEFSAADSTHVEVTPNGTVTGLQAGTVDLIARFEGLETRLTIDVESADAETIQLSTNFVEMNWLEEATVFATAYNAQGRMLNVPMVWRTVDASVATVDDGHIEAVGKGATWIEVLAGDARMTIRVHVDSPPPAFIEVVDTSIYLDVGAQGRIEAIVLAEDGQQIEDAEVTFQSLNPGTLWVEPDTGRTKGLAEGAAKIALSAGDARASFQMFVRPTSPN